MILRCTRCSTQILHRANLICHVMYNLGRQKIPYYSARRIAIFRKSGDDRISSEESGVEDINTIYFNFE
ncbi:hypothetical protein TcasGA2_TC032708 [Tribolium castaneum]|uniref:Uncharacterized protein n=1 Tax=Tribolium castaneum TaxID=7070 RepID=A0A139W909_TRICA|nr:hypothetical protein TcasGA2_TC032708 [Tribolium castaneum]